MSTTPSAPRSATVLWAGALTCALSAVVTIATQGALQDDLAAAYSYTADRSLEGAQSATLTYLFTIAGLGLVFYSAYALAGRRAGRSGLAAWLSVGLLTLAWAVAVYNLTQPFPLAVRLVGLLPPAVGVLAVGTLRAERRTTVTPSTAA